MGVKTSFCLYTDGMKQIDVRSEVVQTTKQIRHATELDPETGHGAHAEIYDASLSSFCLSRIVSSNTP